MKKIFLAATLSVASFGVGLVLAESIVRWKAPQTLTGGFFRVDPNIGYRHRSHYETWQFDGKQKIRIQLNGRGLREDEEVSLEKSENEFRVLALGDSFTFGWRVEASSVFIRRLESKAQQAFPGRRIRFLNAGHGGYTTQNTLAYLESYGLQFKPDYILNFIGPNDVEENGFYTLYQFDENKQLKRNPVRGDWVFRLKAILDSSSVYTWLVHRSHLFYLTRKKVMTFIRHRQLEQGGVELDEQGTVVKSVAQVRPSTHTKDKAPTASVENEPDNTTIELTKALLQETQRVCEKAGIPLSVIHVGLATPDTSRFLRTSQDWFQQSKIDYVDLSRLTTARDIAALSSKRIPGDYHYTADGHRKFAELVWPSIKARLEKLM